MNTEIKKPTIWNKTYISLLTANLFLSLSQYIVNPLVSTYVAWLGAGTVLVGLVTGLYFGIAFAMRPFSGPAVTVLDKRMLMIVSFVIGFVVNMIYALFPSISWFIFARLLHGVQLSIIGSLLMTMAGDSLPPEKLGSGLGIFGLSAAIASAIGPSIGLWLRTWGNSTYGDGGGFKVSFLAAAGIIALAIIPSLMCKVEKRSKAELAGIGPWYKNIIAKEALLPSFVILLFSLSSALLGTYMVPYSVEKGFANIGSYFTVYAFVMLLSRPLCGKLLDKLGAPAVLIPGMLMFAVALVIFSYATSMLWVYVGAVFAAMGFGGALPSVQALCIQAVSPLRRGVASNTTFFGLDLGSFLGPTLGGVVLTIYSGTGHAYASMYLVAIIPVFLSVAVFCLGWKKIKYDISHKS